MCFQTVHLLGILLLKAWCGICIEQESGNQAFDAGKWGHCKGGCGWLRVTASPQQGRQACSSWGQALVPGVESEIKTPMAGPGWIPLGVSHGTLIKCRHLKDAQHL